MHALYSWLPEWRTPKMMVCVIAMYYLNCAPMYTYMYTCIQYPWMRLYMCCNNNIIIMWGWPVLRHGVTKVCPPLSLPPSLSLSLSLYQGNTIEFCA